MRQEAIKDYLAGMTPLMLSKKYNINDKTIFYWLKKEGLKARHDNEANRKFKIDHNFFENIDSLEKAYFLGLLYADGDVKFRSLDCCRIRLRLAQPDQELIQRFSEAICFGENNAKEYENKNGNWPMVGLSIHSKKMGYDLQKLGCVERKSAIIEFKPEKFLHEDLVWIFILGFFDGDGGVYEGIHFTSNETFCNQLRNFFIASGIWCSPYRERKNGYGTIKIHSIRDVSLFCEKTIFKYDKSLQRKREKLLEFISRKPKPQKDRALNIS